MTLSVELHKKFKGFQMDVAFKHDGGSLVFVQILVLQVLVFSAVPVWARA